MTDQDELLHTAWAELRGWLDGPAVAAALDRPSVLEGWTVRELVAHLGRAFTTLTGLVPTDDAPLSIVDYVTSYREAAEGIATATRQQAAELGDDVLAAVDRLAADALAALAEVTAEVVRARRGPITRADFVVTRLLEVVVHGDDLQRSVPEAGPVPWSAEVVDVLASALADGYEARTGHRPPVPLDLAWIRQAAGRAPTDDPALPLL